jgi:hypothetical protein
MLQITASFLTQAREKNVSPLQGFIEGLCPRFSRDISPLRGFRCLEPSLFPTLPADFCFLSSLLPCLISARPACPERSRGVPCAITSQTPSPRIGCSALPPPCCEAE